MKSNTPQFQTFAQKTKLFADDPLLAQKKMDQMNRQAFSLYSLQCLEAALESGNLDVIRQIHYNTGELDILSSPILPSALKKNPGLARWLSETFPEEDEELLRLSLLSGREDMYRPTSHLLRKGDVNRFAEAVEGGNLKIIQDVYSKTGAYDSDLRRALVRIPSLHRGTEIMDWIHQTNPEVIRTVDIEPDRALREAVSRGDADQVRWICQHYPETNLCSRTDADRKAIGIHSEALEDLRWLLRAYPTGSYELLSQHMEALCGAIYNKTGWIPRGVKSWMTEGELDQWVADSRSDWKVDATLDWPLFWAMTEDVGEMVQWICQEEAAGPDDRVDMEFALLCGRGNKDLAGHYLRTFPSLQSQSYSHLPYRLAAMGGHVEITALLENRERGAGRGALPSSVRQSALRLALARGALPYIQQGTRSADSGLSSVLGSTIWHSDAGSRHDETLQWLSAKYGAQKLGPYSSYVFGDVCGAGDMSRANRMIRQYGVDTSAYGHRALRLALEGGHMPIAHKLSGGRPIESILSPGDVHRVASRAARAGEISVLKNLQRAGDWVETALVSAAEKGRLHIMAYLLKEGDVTDLQRAYEAAHYSGRPSVVQWIASQRRTITDGYTAALAAVEGGHRNTLQMALENHPDIPLPPLALCATECLRTAEKESDRLRYRHLTDWLTQKYGGELVSEDLVFPLGMSGQFQWLAGLADEREDLLLRSVYDILEGACARGDEETCSVLANAYPQLCKPSPQLAYQAAEGGYTGVLHWLHTQCEMEGLDVEQLFRAACKGGWKCAAWVADNHSDCQFSSVEECMVDAAGRGDNYLLGWLESAFDGLEWNHGSGQALIAACRGGHYRSCQLLLERGVGADSQDGLAFALAVSSRNYPILSLLRRKPSSLQYIHRGETNALLSPTRLQPSYPHEEAQIGDRWAYCLSGSVDGVRRAMMEGGKR